MEIQFAQAQDLEGILEIYNHAILNTTAVYNYQAHSLEMRRQWWEEKCRLGHPVLVALEQGRVVGFASYGPFRAWAAYQYTMESSVYVHPLHQGKGIGIELYSKLIQEAQKNEVHTLVAGIDAENLVSLALHRKFGFEPVAHFKQVGYKFGKWLDLVFYQLLLDGPANPKEG